MLMYQFRKLSAHAARICTVQFALAFQIRALGCSYCFVVMASDRNNPEKSSQ